MDLTPINSAIDAAFAAAHANPQKQAPTPVAGNLDQTVAVVTYVAPTGSGFRVVATLNIGGCRITRVKNHGPDTASERAWPADIEAHVAAEVAKAKASKAKAIYQQGRAATLSIFNQLQLGVQAQFSPVLDASDKAAAAGNVTVAREIVATCVVPEALAATQADLVTVLDGVVAKMAALQAATTIDEINAIQ